MTKYFGRTIDRTMEALQPVFTEAHNGEPFGRWLFHVARRKNQALGLFVQAFGERNQAPCGECEFSYRRSTSELMVDPNDPDSVQVVHVTWPFADCVSLPDILDGRCGNSIWTEKKGLNSWDRIPEGDLTHPGFPLKARGLFPVAEKRPLQMAKWRVGPVMDVDWDGAIAGQMERHRRYAQEAEKAERKRRRARDKRLAKKGPGGAK
ncbi:hypothetical protein NEMBOFW57_009513 [Staphylotrichum longicolle]|uniref:Uncharacterized protein n=1 Tax=Staphylotrichum longicolle TaxID=669026 RepID=A0AAD4HXU2_9PEZI|nr:hypothetical protein NEMBOFW57_009513 [Staphylotrichum longicolle]